MDWQNIIILVITVLLCVWLPLLVYSVRKALKKSDKNKPATDF